MILYYNKSLNDAYCLQHEATTTAKEIQHLELKSGTEKYGLSSLVQCLLPEPFAQLEKCEQRFQDLCYKIRFFQGEYMLKQMVIMGLYFMLRSCFTCDVNTTVRTSFNNTPRNRKNLPKSLGIE